MDEGDANSVHPHAGLGIDELEASLPSVLHCFFDMRHCKSDVVKTRSSFSDELADRGIVSQCSHQLELIIAHTQKCRFETFLLVRLAVSELGSKQILIERDRLVEIRDRDPDVMNLHDFIALRRAA